MLVAVKTEKPSVNFILSYMKIHGHLCCTLNESLPVHNFVAFFSHLESTGLLSILISNVDTFYFIISKNHKSEKPLSIGKMTTSRWQIRPSFPKSTFCLKLFYCQQICVICHWVSSDSWPPRMNEWQPSCPILNSSAQLM